VSATAAGRAVGSRCSCRVNTDPRVCQRSAIRSILLLRLQSTGEPRERPSGVNASAENVQPCDILPGVGGDDSGRPRGARTLEYVGSNARPDVPDRGQPRVQTWPLSRGNDQRSQRRFRSLAPCGPNRPRRACRGAAPQSGEGEWALVAIGIACRHLDRGCLLGSQAVRAMFRFNRRNLRSRGLLFHTLLRQAVGGEPVSYRSLRKAGRTRPAPSPYTRARCATAPAQPGRGAAPAVVWTDGLRPLEWCNSWPVILVTGVGHQDERATA